MKKIVFIAFLCVSCLFQLQAQDVTKKGEPDEQITVNKQYDENGNLTQYDSTYVHQWSTDSTFNFPFNEHFAFGGNMEELLHRFMGDSAMANFGFPSDFFFSPFDDDFMNPMMTDSVFAQYFNTHSDSLFNFHQMFPDMQAIQKQLEEQLDMQGSEFPEFKSQEQKEEWDKLLKKQQKEKEELMKKWEQENIKIP